MFSPDFKNEILMRNYRVQEILLQKLLSDTDGLMEESDMVELGKLYGEMSDYCFLQGLQDEAEDLHRISNEIDQKTREAPSSVVNGVNYYSFPNGLFQRRR